MATHSSILAWRIPWTEEPGGLQSRGHKESDTTERLSRTSEQDLWARKGCAALFCHQEGWRSGSAPPKEALPRGGTWNTPLSHPPVLGSRAQCCPVT